MAIKFPPASAIASSKNLNYLFRFYPRGQNFTEELIINC
ncbi:hypothetical protein CWATWH8502_307 [Crocosphaera watsonii WH 8502]|uniref:Uncharacterized protein n=5 Tax=Crocosphaera watsonii TaxID=263511 RepID=T2JW86_CROWT|nr:hypothetical protein CWATWH0003_3794 [Crocosphaera watsonii WH 0003]CCQ50167.1 hypothetical protein CWATWH8502_307 [Crocosphaera watsonii WH 8502]CCQ57540.1 hypothetical protein CWATWH0005_3070 [Crocosphaera watsonii WH 0005]CCQ64554.1 hypothetical protein CWATWH0401_891 [Crocosphaera watsonii WH 0401]CCQ69281.1 hypothetical protein CWATWH0402_2028 [Crocosphaera watsonii WH 0402]